MGTWRWNQIEDLFHQAADLSADERPAFLDRVCAGDEELRREVESLLAADIPKDGRFQAAIDQAVEQLPVPTFAGSELIGKRIGPYSITRLIGSGGMGAVYRAVREHDFRMEVAIKLIKRGTDTAAALGRFRVERQILAELQHPNIARLLDGGATETGLPYFVMEYVSGRPLLEHTAQLSLRKRLELFRSVCSAVQYAHDRLIVHRDIKPANILVTPDGIPKLLDFGIAKLLDPAPDAPVTLTAAGARLLTPNYASPEQLRGQPITTATDIYSLGLVLYELLTGKQAHDAGGFPPEAISMEIRDPERPSAIRKHLNPDLDNIVLRALRSEPEWRYQSVREFSEDLGRFLDDMPVQARKGSLLYACRRFLKRKWGLMGLITGTTIGAVLVFALFGALDRFGRSGSSSGAAVAPRDQRWDHLSFEKIAMLGDPAPGGGSFTRDFEPYGLNSRGALAFVADLSTGGEGVFLLPRGGSSSAIAIARIGQPAPGGGTFDRTVLGHTSINDSGNVAFVFGLRPLNPPDLKGFMKAGLYRYSYADMKLSAVVVPSATHAPGFGVFQSTDQHASMNNSGDIVFPGVVRTMAGVSRASGLGQGIFGVDRNNNITKIVAPGDPAPGGSTFDFATNPWINDKGDIAFGAHVAGEECISIMSSGPACVESLYFKSAARGTIESIAHQGEQAPNGQFFRGAWGPALNNRGQLVFMGELPPLAGHGNARGIFIHSRGVTIAIAIPGDMVPDGRKIVTVNPAFAAGNYSLNNQGEVTFNAALENSESGLYVSSQGRLHLVAGTGSMIPGVGTISDVASLMNGGVINDRGQILFSATLTDGRIVLLLATPRVIGKTPSDS